MKQDLPSGSGAAKTVVKVKIKTKVNLRDIVTNTGLVLIDDKESQNLSSSRVAYYVAAVSSALCCGFNVTLDIKSFVGTDLS